MPTVPLTAPLRAVSAQPLGYLCTVVLEHFWTVTVWPQMWLT